MAICYPMTKVEERHVVKVTVPASATLKAGDVVLAETLVAEAMNIEVYAGAQVSDITADEPVIIINQGFEQLADGRRPAGNPNPADFEYTEGTVLTAVRLAKDYKFQITTDGLDNTGVVAPAVDVKLIPQNGDYQLATAASVGTAITALNIEKVTTIGIGGQFGNGLVESVIARVELGR